MTGIDYIKSRIIPGGYRYCYRQWQVANGAGEAEAAMPRMLKNKEAPQELSISYLIDCPLPKYYITLVFCG